tara:strand:+ start:1326 stop:2603 length:1278 start_codon:yes stop_codon:yes gene_type:complete
MKNINKYYFIIINSLFAVFPLSIILGNLFINLNVILLSISALIFYNTKITKFKINFLDKIILIFFCYVLTTLIINFLDSYLSGEIFPKFIISKSLFYLKYLILYLVLRFLMTQKILRLDWFFYACAICAAFVCIDIFIQFSFGKNIFGLEPISQRHFSGVFGNELIAGGYLQRFSLFCIFLPFIIFKKNFFHKVSIQFTVFVIFASGIILSGNRMPLILFVLAFLIYIILEKQFRKYFLIVITITFLFLSLNFSLNKTFKLNASVFYVNAITLVTSFTSKDVYKLPMGVWDNPYVTEFYCFKLVWGKNPFFGGGVKSYRATKGCTTHPHNYYFEILTDLGIFGLSIILFFISTLLYKIFFNRFFTLRSNLSTLNAKSMPFFLLLFIEFFPIRTSGSFFSTQNASIIFLALAILVSLISNKKYSNY